MKLFRTSPGDVAFWRAYNRLRDEYVTQLQRDIRGLNEQVATLWRAIEWRGQINEELSSRLEQAQRTIRDLEAALEMTGFPESLKRPPLEVCEGPFRVTVAPLRAPSAGPSEWRCSGPSLAGRWRSAGRWHRLEDCNRV